MRAQSGFKGDVAARLKGLRDREGMRRLGAVLGRQDVQSPPNSNELLSLQGAVDQPVTPGWRTANGPPELTLREHFLAQALFNKMSGQRLHAYNNSKYFQLLKVYGIIWIPSRLSGLGAHLMAQDPPQRFSERRYRVKTRQDTTR